MCRWTRSLRHSEDAQHRCILLPLFPTMTGAAQAEVAHALAAACGVRAGEITDERQATSRTAAPSIRQRELG
jgi:hypothetical protein